MEFQYINKCECDETSTRPNYKEKMEFLYEVEAQIEFYRSKNDTNSLLLTDFHDYIKDLRVKTNTEMLIFALKNTKYSV